MFQLKFPTGMCFWIIFRMSSTFQARSKKLIKQANDHGSAIGIGHPHQATLDALKRELPKLKGKVRLVPASRLVEVPKS